MCCGRHQAGQPRLQPGSLAPSVNQKWSSMPVAREIFADAEALGSAAADLVLTRVSDHPRDRPFLLGCPGGRSARSTFAAIGARAASMGTDLSRVIIVMMDEYVVPGPHGSFRSVDPAEKHSCRRFAEHEIIAVINSGLAVARAIPDDHLWLPDAERPADYDHRLRAGGGIDLFLLASGAGDGHVAFNPPGADRDSRTRVVDLPDSTRRDNLVTFPSFGGDLEQVPRHGVTVGIGTIRELSAEVIMLLHGPDKGAAADRLLAADAYDPAWPATVVADCRRAHLYLDRLAAPDLDVEDSPIRKVR